MELINKWFCESDSSTQETPNACWDDDQAFYRWKDNPANYEEKLKELRVQKVLHQLSNIGNSASDLGALPQGLAALLQKVDSSRRAQLVHELRRVLD